MNEIKNITATTGEPVTEQAPAVDTPSTPGTGTPDITSIFDGGEIQVQDADMADYEEPVIYQILTSEGVYTFRVFIDPKVYHFDWRNAEIERIVTGTHHVTVSSPEYWNGTIDKKVNVTCDTEGQIVLHIQKLASDDKEDIYNG